MTLLAPDPSVCPECQRLTAGYCNTHSQLRAYRLAAQQEQAAPRTIHPYQPRRPFRCPACDGYGKRQPQGYSNPLPEVMSPCHACDGKGIVWSPE